MLFRTRITAMYRKLKKMLFYENSRSIHGNSRSQEKLFRTRITANVPQIKENVVFLSTDYHRLTQIFSISIFQS